MVKNGKVENLKIGNMKNISNKNKVKCLFGHHNYTIPNKNNPNILICSVCKRFGYRKYSDGYKIWYEYDEKGNMIRRKYSDGYEMRYEYDEKGNLIYRKDSSGYEIRFDERGNMIHRKYSSGFEEWYEYDEKGNMIHRKNSDVYEVWYDGKRWVNVKPKNWKYEKHIK